MISVFKCPVCGTWDTRGNGYQGEDELYVGEHRIGSSWDWCQHESFKRDDTTPRLNQIAIGTRFMINDIVFERRDTKRGLRRFNAWNTKVNRAARFADDLPIFRILP